MGGLLSMHAATPMIIMNVMMIVMMMMRGRLHNCDYENARSQYAVPTVTG